jgi:hypothetical protein
MDEVQYDTRHGGPYDRGRADSYYRRGSRPHYYVANSVTSAKVERANMTEAELEAYRAGYDANEELGDFKDWG